jgi:hypothetical protein
MSEITRIYTHQYCVRPRNGELLEQHRAYVSHISRNQNFQESLLFS